MELEKGTLVTIKGTAKFSKFIGIINSISSDMAINFKVLLSVDNNRNILSLIIILHSGIYRKPVYPKLQMRNLISLDWNWNTLELP